MFGFPKSTFDKTHISSNYLQTVTFQINFHEIKDLDKKKAEIKELIKQIIPDCEGDSKPHRNIDFNQDGSMKITSTNSLEFFSKDKGIVVLINPTFLSFIIQGKYYKNFDDSTFKCIINKQGLTGFG